MKKSLLTLITLLSGAQTFTSAVTTLNQTTSNQSAAFAGQGNTLGTNNNNNNNNSTSTNITVPATSPATVINPSSVTHPVIQPADKSDFNKKLETVISKRVPGYTATDAQEKAALKAATATYKAMNVSKWADLTADQLNDIGAAALQAATPAANHPAMFSRNNNNVTTVNASPADLQELANLTAPSWFTENWGKIVGTTAVAAQLGYNIYQEQKATGGSVDLSKGAGTAALLGMAAYATYNFSDITQRVKEFNTSVRNFGKKTWNWITNFKLKGAEDYIIPSIMTVAAIAIDAKVRGDKSIASRVYNNGITDAPAAAFSFVKDTNNGLSNFVVKGFIKPAPPKPKELTPAELELQKAQKDAENITKQLELELAKLDMEAKKIEAQGNAQDKLAELQERSELMRENAAERLAEIKERQLSRAKQREFRKNHPWMHKGLTFVESLING